MYISGVLCEKREAPLHSYLRLYICIGRSPPTTQCLERALIRLRFAARSPVECRGSSHLHGRPRTVTGQRIDREDNTILYRATVHTCLVIRAQKTELRISSFTDISLKQSESLIQLYITFIGKDNRIQYTLRLILGSGEPRRPLYKITVHLDLRTTPDT